jgi:hypothetical protein
MTPLPSSVVIDPGKKRMAGLFPLSPCGTDTYLNTYRLGERFKKVGRTTGFVTGTVESVNTDIQVDYGTFGGLGTINFKNEIVVVGTKPVSLPGDSGSVWLTASDNYAAALNFAAPASGLRSICIIDDHVDSLFFVRSI